jgi:DNA invertase Pin-like site-specific DNA recombinase
VAIRPVVYRRLVCHRFATADGVEPFHRILQGKSASVQVRVGLRDVRVGRNLKHLIALLDDLQALGIAFVSLAEGIDATTPAGKLQMHILGAIAEFERERIRERVCAGLQRARAQGIRLGRPRTVVPFERIQRVAGLPVDQAALALGVSRSTLKRWRRQMSGSLRAPAPSRRG